MKEHKLKVPSGEVIGMSEQLYQHLQENGQLEILGAALVPGHGYVGSEADQYDTKYE